MYFRRETVKVLPSGELANVQPYHVCTKGQEDRLIFRDEEDLRVAHNLIPVCARRADVIIIAGIVLNTHLHISVLARSLEDANEFIERYKISISKFLTGKYGNGSHINAFRGIDSKPLPLLDNKHVRNTICYIFRNALDIGANIDDYRWSSFRSMFRKGQVYDTTRSVATMTYREKRQILRIDHADADPRWLITEDGVIEPASYCDLEYAEGAFDNDQKFFLKVPGFEKGMAHHENFRGPTGPLLRDDKT